MDNEAHPNDVIQFAQYPDATFRQTYPPIPRKGGNPNAVLNQGAEAGVLSALAAYQRKKGQVPADLTSASAPEPKLPNDPEIQNMKAAGWL